MNINYIVTKHNRHIILPNDYLLIRLIQYSFMLETVLSDDNRTDEKRIGGTMWSCIDRRTTFVFETSWMHTVSKARNIINTVSSLRRFIFGVNLIMIYSINRSLCVYSCRLTWLRKITERNAPIITTYVFLLYKKL